MRLRLALLPVSCLCLAASFPLLWGNAAAQGNPSIVGRWSLYSNLPFFPVHTHLLPTGKVAVWPGDIQAGGVSGNDMHTWDPANGATVPVSSPGYDVFCTGHVFLADGRLFVVGGHIQNGVGLPNASTYDALNNLWTSVPPMSAGRWYPTATVLGNGDALVVSGSINNNIGENLLPSVYQVQSNTWRDLTSAQIFLGLYPRMHLAPDGRVFNSAPSVLTRSLNTSGTGGWSVIANHIVDVYRDYGSSVTYRAGRILVAGGADPPTATAEVIDLNAPIPAWRQVSSMAFPRRQHNAAVLPDGRVLVTGGTSGPGFNNPDTPVFAAEMWDPDAETWTTMASAQIPRLYHSTLVLLPDGRLLSTGGNGYTQPEVYEPPYLFAGARPTIGATPASVGHQQTFFVDTPDAAAVTQVSLVSLPSVTHAFDQNQRFNRLSFTRVAGGLNVVAPSANLAPPGPYMLFILNSNGVPSVASIVRIDRGRCWRPHAHVAVTKQRGGQWPWVHADGQRRRLCLWLGGPMERHGAHHDLRERLEAHGGDSGQRSRDGRVSSNHGLESGRRDFQHPGLSCQCVYGEPGDDRGGRHGHRHLEWARVAGRDGPDWPLRPGRSEFCLSRVDVRQLLTDSRQSPSQRLLPLSSAELIARWRL